MEQATYKTAQDKSVAATESKLDRMARIYAPLHISHKDSTGAEAVDLMDEFYDSIENHVNPWSKSYMKYLRDHRDDPLTRKELDYLRENTGPAVTRAFWSAVNKIRNAVEQ